MPDQPRLAFRIGRYSTAQGDAKLGTQEEFTLEICRATGYEDGGWFGVDDESGSSETRRRQGKGERPDLAWLRSRVEAHAPHRPVAVVGWKHDRIFRDVREKEQWYGELAQFPDVIVHSADAIWNPKKASDRFVSTVITAGDQYYADAVREKVIDRHRQRIADGLPATGKPGFGYDFALDDSGRAIKDQWRVVPAEAALVVSAAADVLAGKTLAAVLDEWVSSNVQPKSGGQWTRTGIRKILTSERIAGRMTYGGEVVGEAPWPRLVDEVTHRRLKIMFDDRRRLTGRTPRSLLTGLLWCGSCPEHLRATRKYRRDGSNYRTYRCACGRSSVRADVVESIYVDEMRRRLDDPRLAEHLSETDTEALQVLLETEAEVELLKTHAGRIPTDVYVAKYDALAKQIAASRRRLSPDEDWAGVDAVASTWDRMSVAEQRSWLQRVVGHMVVGPAARGKRATVVEVRRRLTKIRPAGGAGSSMPRTPSRPR